MTEINCDFQLYSAQSNAPTSFHNGLWRYVRAISNDDASATVICALFYLCIACLTTYTTISLFDKLSLYYPSKPTTTDTDRSTVTAVVKNISRDQLDETLKEILKSSTYSKTLIKLCSPEGQNYKVGIIFNPTGRSIKNTSSITLRSPLILVANSSTPRELLRSINTKYSMSCSQFHTDKMNGKPVFKLFGFE